jgi:hypothetical protein
MLFLHLCRFSSLFSCTRDAFKSCSSIIVILWGVFHFVLVVGTFEQYDFCASFIHLLFLHHDYSFYCCCFSIAILLLLLFLLFMIFFFGIIVCFFFPHCSFFFNVCLFFMCASFLCFYFHFVGIHFIFLLCKCLCGFS